MTYLDLKDDEKDVLVNGILEDYHHELHDIFNEVISEDYQYEIEEIESRVDDLGIDFTRPHWQSNSQGWYFEHTSDIFKWSESYGSGDNSIELTLEQERIHDGDSFYFYNDENNDTFGLNATEQEVREALENENLPYDEIMKDIATVSDTVRVAYDDLIKSIENHLHAYIDEEWVKDFLYDHHDYDIEESYNKYVLGESYDDDEDWED